MAFPFRRLEVSEERTAECRLSSSSWSSHKDSISHPLERVVGVSVYNERESRTQTQSKKSASASERSRAFCHNVTSSDSTENLSKYYLLEEVTK